MARWVLYLRLSESDEVSTSIARQERDLRARAAREDGEVARVWVDDGLSGGKHRAKANAALAMLRDGTADVLAVWHLDRWSRMGLVGVADVLEVLEERPGARFVTDQDGLDSRDEETWELRLGISAVLAKRERARIRTRVKSSIAELRRVGRWSGGVVPWGYRPAPKPDGPGRVLVVDPVERALTEELADRVLSGESYWRLARELNTRGVPAPRSERRRFAQQGREGGELGQWTASGLKNTLASDHMVGRQRHNGALLLGDDGLPRQVWSPVLDLPTWLRLRETLKPREPRGQRRRGARLLSGLAECGECGQPLYVKDHPSSRGGALYECSSHWRGKGNCPGVRIAAGSVEEYVTGDVLALVGSWPVMRVEESVTEEGGASLAEVEATIRTTSAELVDDAADVPAVLRRLEALKTRRAELRTAPATREVRRVPTGLTYAETWAKAESDVEARRALLGDAVERVRVRRATGNNGKFDPRRVVIGWAEREEDYDAD